MSKHFRIFERIQSNSSKILSFENSNKGPTVNNEYISLCCSPVTRQFPSQQHIHDKREKIHVWRVKDPANNLKSNYDIGKPLKFYIKNITPVAGRIFETKNRAISLERFFGRGNFGRSITCLQLCSH